MSGRAVIVAGAGIAGLAAALCFAARGSSVTVCERAERLEAVGAGLQLSPNATRILDRLGVLAQLGTRAGRPQAIVLRSARHLATLARVPLGAEAERRWGAPYLVVHRADLQAALLERVGQQPAITLETGTTVRSAAFGSGARVRLETQAATREEACDLLIGADGVWSTLRETAGAAPSRFSGHVAFRAMLPRSRAPALLARNAVTAFLAPGFHLVAYPLGGDDINLVAVTRGPEMTKDWAIAADPAQLAAATEHAAPALSAAVAAAAPWTAWPIHAMSGSDTWTHPGGMALIGDAAHAMTPYAAQGAAMAIEDAAALAGLAAREEVLPDALAAYERLRRPRIARVSRRARFNRLVWHAAGPVAVARDAVLRLRNRQSLLADLDWLYGYDVEAAPGQAR